MAGATPRTVRLQDLTVDVSLSGVARGDLLYRGASTWNNLAAGTSGHYLRSNGAGADPSWASVSASPAGSSGQVQYNNAGAFGGAALLTYATSGTNFTVTAGATTDVPFAVNGLASQSADLAQFKVNGTTKTVVTKDGFLYVGTDSAPGSYALYVRSTATYPLVLNNTSSSVFYVDSSGNLTLSGGISFATASTSLSLGSSSRIYVKYIQDPAGTSVYMDLSDSGKGVRLVNQTAANKALCIEGATSQSGALVQLQGTSSTTAGTAQAEVDTAWNDSTHATRSADLILRAYYTTTAREGLRIRGGSSDVQLGFYGVTPISRAVLATGAGATVDNVITALQNLGLVKQS